MASIPLICDRSPQTTCRRKGSGQRLDATLEAGKPMKILLYNPDNGVTRNFMPHLWMFLLQSLTPKEHEVVLIDENAKAMTREELVEFCKAENIGLVGIGSMTRMVARAYLVADAIRAAGIPVVMGLSLIHISEPTRQAEIS